jgi:IS30 family transposase
VSAIATRLGRCPSTISREVNNNGGRGRYRAAAADRAAVKSRKRPTPCELATTPRLASMVEAKLKLKWSSEQIAGWLKRSYPDRAATSSGSSPNTSWPSSPAMSRPCPSSCAGR